MNFQMTVRCRLETAPQRCVPVPPVAGLKDKSRTADVSSILAVTRSLSPPTSPTTTDSGWGWWEERPLHGVCGLSHGTSRATAQSSSTLSTGRSSKTGTCTSRARDSEDVHAVDTTCDANRQDDMTASRYAMLQIFKMCEKMKNRTPWEAGAGALVSTGSVPIVFSFFSFFVCSFFLFCSPCNIRKRGVD